MDSFNPDRYTLPYEDGKFWLPDGSSLSPFHYRLEKEFVRPEVAQAELIGSMSEPRRHFMSAIEGRKHFMSATEGREERISA